MTTTTTTTSVDRLLEAFEGGTAAGVAALYAPAAVLDATVPGWRFTVRGPDAIASQFAGWFTYEGRFEELERRPAADGSGEVVTYLFAWIDGDGVPHAARHAHVMDVDPATGMITRDQFFCGGQWGASLLAEMAAADNAD